MKLWILRPFDRNDGPWRRWYDKVFGVVVCAEDESMARAIAAEYSGEEANGEWKDRRNPWLDGDLTSCVELVAGDKPALIMVDFHAA